jgi:hypothetical protein
MTQQGIKLGNKSIETYASKHGAVDQNGKVVFPSWENLRSLYKNLVTDIVNDFVAMSDQQDEAADPSVVTDIEPKPSTPSDQYYGPAMDAAIGILHSQGYEYQMTENGLAWVVTTPKENTLVQ